jgi:hypothetical protein
MLPIAALTFCLLAVSGCASSDRPPPCDWNTQVATCSASVEPQGKDILVLAPRCSSFTLSVDGSLRTVRTEEGAMLAGQTNQEISAADCKQYKDIRPLEPAD